MNSERTQKNNAIHSPNTPNPTSTDGSNSNANQPISLSPNSSPPSTQTNPQIENIRAAVDLHTEILVLGSGPGGYTAAFRAADLGKQVTIIEKYPSLGGVCLNVGCIPSKTLLHAAKILDEANDAKRFGISFATPQIDLDQLRQWKDKVIGTLAKGIVTMAKQRKIQVIQGIGRLSSPNTMLIEMTDGIKHISFDCAIIAAGSHTTRLPNLPYSDSRLISSTQALQISDIPKQLLIIGGGIIGLEMATVYSALGSQITIAELSDQLIPTCDPDIVRPLYQRIARRYKQILLGTKVTRIEPETDGLRAFFDGPKAPASELFERILFSVGRKPNGPYIGADAAGINLTADGFLITDRQMRTNVSHIFAIGDITGQPMLAHKASHQAKIAAEVAAGHRSSFDARVIPSVAYTDPEIAWVGPTETEAKQLGINFDKAIFPWAANGRSLSIGRNEGKTKLLFDPQTKRIIAAAIVGPNAGDLISEAALAIEMGCDAEDLALTIHPHPTLSETIPLAAEVFSGTITDLYLPKNNT
jgi:dihydrolipoamide dehydrogenase